MAGYERAGVPADEQHDATIEDVRAQTGILAAALRATMRSATFALYATFAVRAYDEGAGGR